MLFDTHVHLNDNKLFYEVDKYIDNARNNGVSFLNVVGYNSETNRRAIELAEKYDFIYASVGFHPTDAHLIKEEEWIELENLIKHKKVIAIGECGLDYHWNPETSTIQKEVFIRQIDLAKQYKKPIVVHMRDATMDTFNLLEKQDISKIGGIMHCYSGSSEMATRFVEIGMHISLGGPVTFKNAKQPKLVAQIIPLNRLLIETDAPYLTPHPYRGKQNEPKYVKLVAEEIANIRELSYEEIATITTYNAKKLFSIKGD